ncbi:ATP-grasp domain-containing protein [Leptothoe spongobia]|uniref:ATP-grasp domain-containing protein n=1 Tax=Leptothoe spongobia TAU-MAC 1115 TaxID=1967444 RepID=A0A947GS01_9CYAN|nr:hypothetical protein [Leptothoe spongobia]MBT9317726.1 hypothetical protein [Leptothoe spongobia TAU-MAC 1115]
MIYAIGLDTDKTYIHFLKEAHRRKVEIQPINLRALAMGEWDIVLPVNEMSALYIDGKYVALDPNGSYFCRLVDLASVFSNFNEATCWRGMIFGLSAWLREIPGVVINRPGFQNHNSSKPFHENFLQSLGFLVPPSITSSDASRLYEFACSGPTIVKTISGVRANCRIVCADEFLDFDSSQGPVHLQRYIDGSDIRAHVIGNVIHAQLIQSSKVDYRLDYQESTFQKYQFPEELDQKIIEATKKVGLTLAGWDFKLTKDNRFWCFEVNPTPAYDSYDRRANGDITSSLIDFLINCSN